MRSYEEMIAFIRKRIAYCDEMIELCGHEKVNRETKLEWILLKHAMMDVLGEKDRRNYWKEDKPYWDKENKEGKKNAR